MKEVSSRELEDFRLKKFLPKQFILFAGKVEPRKNIIGVIRAFATLKKQPEFKNLFLVMAGADGWLSDETHQEAENSRLAGFVRFIGQISDEERKYYYNLASVFVYPSFFEGFGFPPLEAMACGCPVIVSNNSSLPEVAGDAGILVDPYSVTQLAGSVQMILTDKELRGELIKKGLKRAKQFSWETTARKTLETLTK